MVLKQVVNLSCYFKMGAGKPVICRSLEIGLRPLLFDMDQFWKKFFENQQMQPLQCFCGNLLILKICFSSALKVMHVLFICLLQFWYMCLDHPPPTYHEGDNFCMYILMKRDISARLFLLCQIPWFVCSNKSFINWRSRRSKTLLIFVQS